MYKVYMYLTVPSSTLSVLIAGGLETSSFDTCMSFSLGLLSTWSFVSSTLFFTATPLLSSGFFTKPFGFFWAGKGFLGGRTGLWPATGGFGFAGAGCGGSEAGSAGGFFTSGLAGGCTSGVASESDSSLGGSFGAGFLCTSRHKTRVNV